MPSTPPARPHSPPAETTPSFHPVKAAPQKQMLRPKITESSLNKTAEISTRSGGFVRPIYNEINSLHHQH
jgi:hypothetical protein